VSACVHLFPSYRCTPPSGCVKERERERDGVCDMPLYICLCQREAYIHSICMCRGRYTRREGKDRLRQISIETDRGKNFTSVQVLGQRGVLEYGARGQVDEDKEGVQVRYR
jgi:hypothetical protein